MSRVVAPALLAVIAVACIGGLPLACQSGGVGDPCTPEDEYSASFAQFKVTEENIESRSFQCATRICLVNHFQGRVTCPLGQAAPAPCDPAKAGADCKAGETCVSAGASGFVCHSSIGCQSADGTSNAGKDCCLPSSETPVPHEVCGQCAAASKRAAADSVYCSCRCGVADGDPDEPDFNFCSCPSGFECSEIRRDVGLGDRDATGKYCIKSGTAYANDNGVSCGAVAGHTGESCSGISDAM